MKIGLKLWCVLIAILISGSSSIVASIVAPQRDGYILRGDFGPSILNLTFTSVPGRAYKVQVTDNLALGKWSTLNLDNGLDIIATNTTTTVQCSNYLEKATIRHGTNLFVRVVALPSSTLGQLQWVRTSSAGPGPNTVQLAVTSDRSGNSVAVGWFAGTVDFGAGPMSSTTTLDTDGFIIKRDSSGNLLWTKRIGSTGADAATGVTVDSQGNILVTGYFTVNVDFGGTTLTSVPSPIPGGAAVPDIFIAKYSPSGMLLWAKGFGGGFDDRGVSVAVDANDNVVIASEIKSISASFGGISLNTVGNYDVTLAKLTGATGATLWAISFGGNSVDIPSGVTVDRFGNVLLTGSFAGGKLAKYSGTDGNLIWMKAPSGSVAGIVTDPATGNIFVTGGNAGIFLSCYDPSGQHVWTVSSGADSDSGAAVALDPNGNLAITGKAANAINFGTWPQDPWLSGNAQPNMFVAAFTVSGNSPPTYRWSKTVEGSSTSVSCGTGVAYDSLGHMLVGGYFTATINFGGVSATNPSGYNAAFLAEYNR